MCNKEMQEFLVYVAMCEADNIKLGTDGKSEGLRVQAQVAASVYEDVRRYVETKMGYTLTDVSKREAYGL